MARVLVTRQINPRAAEQLTGHEVWTWPENRTMPRDLLLERVSKADGALVMLTDRVDDQMLDAGCGLRVVSQMAVGVDNVDLSACTRRGIPVGHTPDVLTETTADMAWALLAAAARRIPEGREYVLGGHWGEWDPDLLLGNDLWGTTLGIVGMGRIGAAVARRAVGFSMQVIYNSRSPKPKIERETAGVYASLDDLLSQSDHVVVTAAYTPQTHHLIDAGALARMRPDATLVNIARGPLVDPEALHYALRSGVIGSAALDVTEPEPIPSDHPLLALPNCLVIPHLGSASRGTRLAMATRAVENLLAGLAGEPVPWCANPEVYLT
jgi:lactate dehydrogenase-like 2-hydroxyacid dehydrogenase